MKQLNRPKSEYRGYISQRLSDRKQKITDFFIGAYII
jgi:hypothetical protein